MVSIKKILVFVFLFFGFCFVNAQQLLSLDDAILKGLDNNFNIRISKQQYDISRINNTEGAAGRWPSISLGVNSINRYDNTPFFDTTFNENVRNDVYSNQLTPYVNVRWVLFDGMRVNISKQKLDLLETFSAGYSTIVIENTLQAIILSYYNALLQEERLKVLKEVKELSGDRYAYEMMRKQIGTSVTFDVLQAKNSFFSDSTNYLLQELNVKNAFLRLNLLLGESPDVRFALVDSFDVKIQDYDLQEMMDKMLSNNSNLKNQYINQEILKRDIGLAKSDVWPSLSMNAGADYTEAWYDFEKSSVDNNSLDYYANFTLSFNLFNGGNTSRTIKTSQINERIGQLEIQQLEQTLENLLVNEFELYNIRKQLLDVANVNLESAKLNMEIATEKYRNGTINSFNFRDVQLIFLNAASNKLNAIYDLIDSQTELLRLTGGIINNQ